MEVHAHTHTARKKWTHYFWEFLMLFFAVTLGFFVENQREHYIEHQRARVFAKAMVKNLVTDTAELNQIIYRTGFAAAYLDTFITLLSRKEISEIPTGKLYWYGLWGGYIRGFEPNDATYQQMKNSGSLRYFNDPQLEEEISQYDQVLRSMKVVNELDRLIWLETRKARSGIFDFKYNADANAVVQSAVYNRFRQEIIDSFIKIDRPLLTIDKVQFNQYAELCRSRNIRLQLKNAEDALKLATSVIERLKNAYHIK